MADAKQDPVHWADVPLRVCEDNQKLGAALICLNPDGTISMSSHGVNHAKLNELLCVAIHINLMDHDRMVLAGAAGPDAQAQAELLAMREVH